MLWMAEEKRTCVPSTGAQTGESRQDTKCWRPAQAPLSHLLTTPQERPQAKVLIWRSQSDGSCVEASS